MASRSGGIKGRGAANGPPPSSDDVPVYPFTLDVPSMPERRHIAGIYVLARVGFVSMLLSMVLCAMLVIRSLSISSMPFFLYWHEGDSKFKFMPSVSDPVFPRRTLFQNEYLTEYFAREYIRRTFEVSPTLADNETVWCDCSGVTGVRAESIFDPMAPCFICSFSSPAIYSSFTTNQKPAATRLAASGASREVHISNVERIRRGSPEASSSIFDTLINIFLTRENPIPIYTEYRIDFILEDRLGMRIRYEAMRSYMTVLSYVGNLNFYNVIEISYMFEPAHELAIGKHLGRRSTEEK